MSEFWICPKCGLQLSFKEVCQSAGHNCEQDQQIIEELIKTCKIFMNTWNGQYSKRRSLYELKTEMDAACDNAEEVLSKAEQMKKQ